MGFVKRHRLRLGILSFIFMALPQAIDAIWSLAERIQGANIVMPAISITWFMWITIPIGLIMLGIIIWQGRVKQESREVFAIEYYGYDFGQPNVSGYPSSQVRRILRVELLVHAIPTKWVESVQLELSSNLIATDWQPDYVSGGAPTGGYYYFNIPDSIKEGKYTAKLIAFAEDISTKSKPFEIEVPK